MEKLNHYLLMTRWREAAPRGHGLSVRETATGAISRLRKKAGWDTPRKMIEASTMRPFLEHLARESARVIMPLFADPALKVEWKADQTPVTYADRKAEEVLRGEIERNFPDHGILGEEFGETRADAPYRWILDPIDGTKTFTAGSPHFGTLICLRHENRPLWGAIHLPALHQLYVGDNQHAWCNNRPIRLREAAALGECFLLTTDPKSPPRYQSAAGWEALLSATGQYRSWGDCFGYTLVARGTADIMCDPIMNLWDIAALLPVVRGAGAAASDWQGGDPDSAESLVVAHPRHHAAIIRLLNPEPATGPAA